MRLHSTIRNCILKASSDEAITPSLVFFCLFLLPLQCLSFSDEIVPITAALRACSLSGCYMNVLGLETFYTLHCVGLNNGADLVFGMMGPTPE